MEFSRDKLATSQYSLHAVQRTFSMSHESIRQQCPHCLASYKIAPAYFGKRVKCGKCGKEFRASSPPPPLHPTPSSAGESERFTINTDAPRGEPQHVGSTKSQNINKAMKIIFALTLIITFFNVIGGNTNIGDVIRAVLFGPLVVIAYFAPSFIAYSRDHNNFLPLVIINTAIGWTGIGWVACIAWALSSDIKESRVHIRKVIVQTNHDDEDFDS